MTRMTTTPLAGLARWTGLGLLAAALAGCAVGPDYATPGQFLPGQWGNAPKTSKPLDVARLGAWWKKLDDRRLNDIVERAVAGNLDVGPRHPSPGHRRAPAAGRWAGLRDALALLRRDLVERLQHHVEPVSGRLRCEFRARPVRRQLPQCRGDDLWRRCRRRGSARHASDPDRGCRDQLHRGARLPGPGRARPAHGRLAARDREAYPQQVQRGVVVGAGRRARRRTGRHDRGRDPDARGVLRAKPAPARHSHRRGADRAGRPARLGWPDPRRARHASGWHPRRRAGQPARCAPRRAPARPGDGQDRPGRGGALSQRQPDREDQHHRAQDRRPRQELVDRLVLRADAQRPDLQRWRVAGGRRGRGSPARPVRRGAAARGADGAAGCRELAGRAGKLSAATNSFREAARLSRTLYQSGAASFLDVLDAERSLYSAEDTLLQSRVAVTSNFVSLNKALGGGWDKPVDVLQPRVVDTNTGPHPRAAY